MNSDSAESSAGDAQSASGTEQRGTPQMSITLLWGDGEEKELEGVEKFSWGRNQDDAVVMVSFADGRGDTYSGKRLVVNGGAVSER